MIRQRIRPGAALLATLTALAATAVGAPAARAQDALPPADEIIQRHVEAIGGEAAVLAHSSSRTTGTFAMPAAGITGDLVVEMATPNRIVTRIDIPGLGRIQSGYDGEVGWSVDPNLGPRLLDGMELASMVEGADPRATLRDAALFSSRETVELTEMNGEACYRVRLVWNSGRETTDCYSVESGLLIASTSTQETPMGDIESVSLLEDYQETGGVLSPTRVRQQAMGQEQVMEIDTIEYGVVDDSAFDLPDTIRALLDEG